MKKKTKFLMSILAMTLLMTGFVNAMIVPPQPPVYAGSPMPEDWCELYNIDVCEFTFFSSVDPPIVEPISTSGKATFDLGYDCYHQPGVYWRDCKQVEHKRSWFERKDFYIRIIHCYPDGDIWTCHYTWIRYPKL